MCLCVFLSLFLHALSFYVFQVAYPPSVSLLPSPVRLFILDRDSEAGATLVRWIEAEDPGLSSLPYDTGGKIAERIARVPYPPSYASARPKPKPLKDAPPDLTLPSSFGPAETLRCLQRRFAGSEPENGPPSLTTTRMVPGDALGALLSDTPVQLDHEVPEGVTVEPSSFLVGVAPSGRVLHIFLQQSSGDADLDAATRAHLYQFRFPRTDGSDPAWGLVTYYYGSMIYRRTEAAE